MSFKNLNLIVFDFFSILVICRLLMLHHNDENKYDFPLGSSRIFVYYTTELLY